MNHICENCGRREFKILFNSFVFEGSFRVARCRDCGLTQTLPKICFEHMLYYYPKEYYGLNNIKFKGPVETLIHLKRSLRASRIRKMNRIVGKVIDIGCGRGIFLDKMRKSGWETQGTEISTTAGMYAREILKLNVNIGILEDQKFGPDTFDVATMYHVLEHVVHPFETITELHRILKPGGLFVVAIPNIDSWQAGLFGRHWFHLDVPRHCCHFSRDILEKLESFVYG